MNPAAHRGAALPETALTIGLAMLLILGSAQLAILSITQLSADGGAFVAAHTLAANPSASPLPVVQGIFPGIKTGDLSASNAGPNLEKASVTASVGGFSLPGYPSSYSVSGSDLEIAPANSGASAQTYVFGPVSATILNYCPMGVSCSFPSTRAIYIAQTMVPGGNGVNGIFQEWGCHADTFSSISFPVNRPTPGLKWDPTDPHSGAEYTIYHWDPAPGGTGTPC